MTLAAISTPTSTGKVDSLPTAPSPSTLHVLPRITPVPTSDDYPTEVVVALTTTILIPDYPLYYHMPISQFSPRYQALPDGSLIAAPYRYELQQDNGVLLLMGILLTIFLRNALVSGNYLRRIKVQRTIIFRMLFASQVIASIGLVPKIASFLTPHVNCHIVQIVISVASTLSIVFIMSGIFGYKAYKCLDNSVFVLATLAILTVGAAIAHDLMICVGSESLLCFNSRNLSSYAAVFYSQSGNRDITLLLRGTAFQSRSQWISKDMFLAKNPFTSTDGTLLLVTSQTKSLVLIRNQQ
ncbi:hypothetical protein HHX47_DHR1001905 [Lentinula edodes]|nr:hypothetical protein HHX47_DHR1001905 [Lentinula edodes]